MSASPGPPASPERTIRMGHAAPTFLVSDVAAITRWYAEQLGFRILGTFPATEPHAYASVGRDGVEIMFLRLAAYQKPDLRQQRPEGLWDAYIRMSGVEVYYESLKAKPFIHMALTRQTYGDVEFEVRDPNGYILVFSG